MRRDLKGGVATALDLVLDEIDRAIAAQRTEINSATQAGKYDQAEAVIARVKSVAAFRDKVVALRRQWPGVAKSIDKSKARGRRGEKRLARGVRTPEAAFRLPILRALVAAGGRAKMSDVLARVYAEMKAHLTPADLATLPSSLKTVRWRNTAQWVRARLKREGLLKPDSPHGVWEISDKGREALKLAPR